MNDTSTKEIEQAIFANDVVALRLLVEENPSLLKRKLYIRHAPYKNVLDYSLRNEPFSSNIEWIRFLAEKQRVNPDVLLFAMYPRNHLAFFPIYEILLENGADVNAIGGYDKNTLLHYALQNRYQELVDFLLDHGADPNIANKKGESPLHVATAAVALTPKLLRKLLRQGADVNYINPQTGDNLLHLASFSPEIQEIITPLLHPTLFSMPNKIGDTPLHKIRDDHGWLIQHGASVDAPNHEGKTPLDLKLERIYGDRMVKAFIRDLMLPIKQGQQEKFIQQWLPRSRNKNYIKILSVNGLRRLVRLSPSPTLKEVQDKAVSMGLIGSGYTFHLSHEGHPLRTDDDLIRILQKPGQTLRIDPFSDPKLFSPRVKETRVVVLDRNGEYYWVMIRIAPDGNHEQIACLRNFFKYQEDFTLRFQQSNTESSMIGHYEMMYRETKEVLSQCLGDRRKDSKTNHSFRFNIPRDDHETRKSCEGYLCAIITRDATDVLMSVTIWIRELGIEETVQEHALIVGNLQRSLNKTMPGRLSLRLHSFAANLINSDLICARPYPKMQEIFLEGSKRYGYEILTNQDSKRIIKKDEIDHCAAFGCAIIIPNTIAFKKIWIDSST